ncbi:hypothetical protein [Kordiimonas aestuarii]|uniref:hypothetical protein n=1 Tax=Kordiimonas aestuarii TaxID=1005925 RepID=UPI0021CE0D5E|nr:hypothetical protein [Kordiimonas aestuarii]
MISTISRVAVPAGADYMLALSFDPCQISKSLHYEFSIAVDGSGVRKAIYGPNAGCFYFQAGKTMAVTITALCSHDSSMSKLPDIDILAVQISLNDQERHLDVQKGAEGDYYVSFVATELYQFVKNDDPWPLSVTVVASIDGQKKIYSFDPEVIVGDGEF